MKKMFLGLVGAVAFLAANASYALDVVTQDSGTGAVTFDPTALTSPITATIIETIAATAVIVLIVVGVQWVYRIIKGR